MSSPSALDDVDRQAAARGFLVLGLHVGTGVAHGLDDFVEAHMVDAVAAQRHPRGVDRLHRGDRIALDAGDLHQPADRVTGQAQVMFHADLCGVLHLFGRAAGNAIGIDPSVGALKEYLTSVKAGKNPRDNNMIKSLNFDYSGPIDGHDFVALLKELNRLKHKKGPKFLHVITTKGKGMQLAEEDQVKYHAPGKFNPETGEILPKAEEHLPPKFQDVFGLTLVELAQQNKPYCYYLVRPEIFAVELHHLPNVAFQRHIPNIDQTRQKE